jgi:hypothetical protein
MCYVVDARCLMCCVVETDFFMFNVLCCRYSVFDVEYVVL